MSAKIRAAFGKLAALALCSIGALAIPLTPANAQPYWAGILGAASASA